MARTRLLRVVDSDGRFIGLVLLSLVFLAPTLQPGAAAQPVAQGPREVNRLRPWIDPSPDFSRSQAFDLTRPVQLQVRVEGLLLPEGGDAELLFTVLRDAGEELALRRGQTYHATLQRGPEARRLGINGRQLRGGRRALLRGWPATGAEQSPTVLLVDEIAFKGGGKPLRLHDAGTMERERKRRERRRGDD